MWLHIRLFSCLLINGELVVTTPEHPFYTGENQWVNAGDLTVGDEIRALDWTVGEIENSYTVATPRLMYNLTVDTAHTFFVGDEQWLVHNCGAFGQVKFKGLVKNRNMQDLTHNQLSNAMTKIGLDPTNHFIKQLRNPRAGGIGVNSLSDVEKIFNKGAFVDQGDGTGAIIHDGMAIIFDLETKKLVTLTPWSKSKGIP